MDEDALLLAIGKLQGQMEGIGRELKTVKEMIGESNANTHGCLEGIKERVSYLELNGAKISQANAAELVIIKGRVDKLETVLNTEKVVEKEKSHWIDSIYAKIGMVLTAFFAAATFLRDVLHWP